MEGEGRMALLFGRDKEGFEREVRDSSYHAYVDVMAAMGSTIQLRW